MKNKEKNDLANENREEIIIDGEKAAAGRLATFAAKQALLGNNVTVLNCKKVVVTGPEKAILAIYRNKRDRGGTAQKGPYFSRSPEEIIRRTIRGMLPWKKSRGREVFKQIRCYPEIPAEYQNKEKIRMKEASKPYLSVDKISRLI